MNIEKVNEICIEIYGKLAGDFDYRFADAILQAATREASSDQEPVVWQDGVGMLWDVYSHGKLSKKVVSPIGWDAWSVYRHMVDVGKFSPNIDVRLADTRATPTDHSSYALQMLVAAGHIPQAKVDEALALAAKIPGVGEAQSVRDAELDSARLDYLDKRNARKNESNGTVYGWKVNENHNRIALEDHAWPAVSVREAIDRAMKDVPL